MFIIEIKKLIQQQLTFHVCLQVKASACNAGDLGSIPGLGRSPGEGNSNPLQYSCLENPMDRGVWWAIVHGVAKSWTQLSDFTFILVHTRHLAYINLFNPPSIPTRETLSLSPFYRPGNWGQVVWQLAKGRQLWVVKQNQNPGSLQNLRFYLSHTDIVLTLSTIYTMARKCGFPAGTRGKEPACQCRRHKRHRFHPWVGKIPWRRAWQPTPVFLPGESPWTEEPGRLQSIGLQRVGHNWRDWAQEMWNTVKNLTLTKNALTVKEESFIYLEILL